MDLTAPSHCTEEEKVAVRDKILQNGKIVLNPKQEECIKTADKFNGGVKIIQGTPGAGKSLTMSMLTKLYAELGAHVILGCPTNAAADALATSLKSLDGLPGFKPVLVIRSYSTFSDTDEFMKEHRDMCRSTRANNNVSHSEDDMDEMTLAMIHQINTFKTSAHKDRPLDGALMKCPLKLKPSRLPEKDRNNVFKPVPHLRRTPEPRLSTTLMGKPSEKPRQSTWIRMQRSPTPTSPLTWSKNSVMFSNAWFPLRQKNGRLKIDVRPSSLSSLSSPWFTRMRELSFKPTTTSVVDSFESTSGRMPSSSFLFAMKIPRNSRQAVGYQ